MFAEKIKKLRKDAGRTQSDLAAHIGVLRSTYGEYERGKIKPPYDKIKAIADYFGVSVNYLMEDKKEEIPDIANILTELLKTLEKQEVKFEGDDLGKGSRELIVSNIENSLKMAKLINKRS